MTGKHRNINSILIKKEIKGKSYCMALSGTTFPLIKSEVVSIMSKNSSGFLNIYSPFHALDTAFYQK